MHLGRYVFLHYLSFTFFFPLTSDLIVRFNNLLTVIVLLLKVQKKCFEVFIYVITNAIF